MPRLVLRLDGRLALLAGNHHHPASIGPLRKLARQIVDQRLRRALFQCNLQAAVLAANQPHVALERKLHSDVALVRRERNQFLEARNNEGRSGRLRGRLDHGGDRRLRHAAWRRGAWHVHSRRQRSSLRKRGSRARVAPLHRCGRDACRRAAVALRTAAAAAALKRADRLIGRGQIGRIGDAHQNHLGRGQRAARRFDLGDALEQHLPCPREHPHR